MGARLQGNLLPSCVYWTESRGYWAIVQVRDGSKQQCFHNSHMGLPPSPTLAQCQDAVLKFKAGPVYLAAKAQDKRLKPKVQPAA